jgi:hypothetical protein
MHPSNNLLLPILRKHGDRLLKAQIEAMVKELSWEEMGSFLKLQLIGSIDEIREKLAQSYPDYAFLTEWKPEIMQTSLKTWAFGLSGEQNFLAGIDDFSLTLTLFELGKPMRLTGYTVNTQSEIHVGEGKDVFRNGYRVKPTSIVDHSCIISRSSRNELEDTLLAYRGIQKINTMQHTSFVEQTLRKLFQYK